MFNAIQRGPNQEYDVYVCLSTDVKKTDGIHNGDMLIEIDTSAMYIFDAVSSTWKALNSGGGGGTDVSDTTAIAADVLAGKDFYLADGTKTSGTIQAKAAQTYTPGTTAQTIAAGQYLSGAQTIAGDANLIAANILQGVSIFGVAGSASGADPDYTINFPKDAAVAVIEDFLDRYAVLSNPGAAQDWAAIKSQIFGL